MKLHLLFLIFISWAFLAYGQELPPKQIHVIVALCDNASQGIAPVNERIGNGDDLINNLYWGCSDGLWRYFKKSDDWQLIEDEKDQTPPAGKFAAPPILQKLTFKHTKTNSLLIAEAWRGKEIKAATKQYFDLIGDNSEQTPDLVAWIGHNSLMDFPLNDNWLKPSSTHKDTIVLACKSNEYHGRFMKALNTRPILMTDQFMYPGSFLLKNALDGWLNNETLTQIRSRAAKGYMANQKISYRAALGIFTDLSKPKD